MVSLQLAVTLISLAWSIGLFVGLFTARFMSKKECKEIQCKVWERIDAIHDVMAGGKITFELRAVKEKNN